MDHASFKQILVSKDDMNVYDKKKNTLEFGSLEVNIEWTNIHRVLKQVYIGDDRDVLSYKKFQNNMKMNKTKNRSDKNLMTSSMEISTADEAGSL